MRSSAFLTIRPGVAGGAPCIGRTGTPAWAVVGCVWAGDSVNSIADDYDLTRDEVLLACWYVATYGIDAAWWNGSKRRREGAVWTKRWGTWASQHSGDFWRHELDDIPDPPAHNGE